MISKIISKIKNVIRGKSKNPPVKEDIVIPYQSQTLLNFLSKNEMDIGNPIDLSLKLATLQTTDLDSPTNFDIKDGFTSLINLSVCS